ncbi:MAG: 16S rRNA (cytosine(1402)-N(4))-methyltransferase RsmH [bacterium]|nr:16S rRNA (cytosine(1402)-N(4))-methyltransferase RsmH [bacterium]
MSGHTPVLLKEVIHYLDPKPGDTILDATINGGGHAMEILKAIGDEGLLVGIEQDAEILERLKAKIEKLGIKNVILINGNFRNLDKLLAPACRQAGLNKIIEKGLDGAIFDLGMSSLQFEPPDGGIGRGFSFQKDEPLLMTLKSDIGPDDLTARDIVNEWSEEDIANVLFGYGEERHSRRIAKGIVKARAEKRIETTFDLVEAIRTSVPAAYRNSGKINCCTRTFQALRIAVNDELKAAEEGIEKAWNLLAKGGRLAVISFHSLEDRIVKIFFKRAAKEGEGEILTKKPVTPSDEEKKSNPRSRSAKLRAVVKL